MFSYTFVSVHSKGLRSAVAAAASKAFIHENSASGWRPKPSRAVGCNAGKRPALSGIFATWVHGVGDAPWPSVSSLGTRPTVHGTEPLLEAHLFDFNGDLYAKRIEVEFVAKLRDEDKFDDLSALVRQMDIDSDNARRALQLDVENRGVLA